MSDEVRPYRLDVPDEVLRDLRERLRRTRWPEAATVPGWGQGAPLDYVQQLCEYWGNGYEWRATEARLARLPQFRTPIGGLDIHFIHVRSVHPGAVPLVLTHGWPGSVVEFLKVIGPLTAPENPADAFDVVCPSLPGYGFSDKPSGPGWGVERIARAWHELMARLGYERYGAQGHDWGTSISTSLAERAALADLERGAVDGDGCAWIVEKFAAWTDCDGDLASVLTRDAVLDNLMLYWLPGTGASSARLYWDSFKEVQQRFAGATTDSVTVPTGCSVFPKENPRPSRRWAGKRFTDIRYWNEPSKGGHLAAFEQPGLFVDEARAFFRLVR
jgi:pimeloyl-ACP methyl ester carboxylesterase